MTLVVDQDSSVPPFEQLRRQLVEQIESGQLPERAKLPPVRRLAENLGLAANTVARAYRELEASGFVVTGGRNGTSVAPGRVRAADPKVAGLVAGFFAAMAELGYDREAAIAHLQRAGGH